MPRHKRPEVEVTEDSAEEVVLDQDDVASELAKLGRELSAVATDKMKRTTKLREVEAFLGRLRIEDFPELADSPTIQRFVGLFADPKNLKPGEVRHGGTLAEVRRDWNYSDLELFPKRTFYSPETLPITWNGLVLYVKADQENTMPEPFYDIFMMHRKALANAAQHEKFMLGQTTIAPDRNWMTDATYRIRGLTMQGKGTLGVGPLMREATDVDVGSEGEGNES